MLPLRTRRRVQRLLERRTIEEVAETTGVSVSSVKRIANEPWAEDLDDAAERKRRGIGRPSKVARYERRIQRMLDRNPDITTAAILVRLRKAGYAGGATAVYSFVAELRE
jgi:transposase